ncbi:hypothetical protein D3C78_1073570 [compost metagenome]
MRWVFQTAELAEYRRLEASVVVVLATVDDTANFLEVHRQSFRILLGQVLGVGHVLLHVADWVFGHTTVDGESHEDSLTGQGAFVALFVQFWFLVFPLLAQFVDTRLLTQAPTTVATEQGGETIEHGLPFGDVGLLDAVPDARHSFHRDLVVRDHIVAVGLQRGDLSLDTGVVGDTLDTLTNHDRSGLVRIVVFDQGFEVVMDLLDFLHRNTERFKAIQFGVSGCDQAVDRLH